MGEKAVPMKRRLAAFAALGLSAALAVAGCSSSKSSGSSGGSGGSSGGSGGNVTLNFYGADYGTAGTSNSSQIYWQKIADAFHAKYPNITVKVQTTDWTDYPKKVPLLIQDHQYPDILEGTAAPSLAQAGLIYPDSEIASPSTLNNLMSVFVKQTAYQGTDYGLPWTTSSRALFYNKLLFKKAGITTPPTTWDELSADAAKIKALPGNNIGYGMPLGPEEAQAESLLWMLGNGGGYQNASGQYDINSPQNIATFQYMSNMVSQGLTEASPATTDRKTVWSEFAAGQVGMVGGSTGLLPIIAQANKLTSADYGVTAVPGKTAALTQTLGVHDDIVAFKAGGSAKLQAIKEFIDFIYQDQYQAQFNALYNLLPATNSEAAKLASSPVYGPFLTVLQNTVVYPSNPNWQAVQDKIQTNIGQAVQGSSPASVLGQLQQVATSGS
jgi:multiple sugar transport system substrate-binding protein